METSNTSQKFEIGEIVLAIKNPFLKLKILEFRDRKIICSVWEEVGRDHQSYFENELMKDESIPTA